MTRLEFSILDAGGHSCSERLKRSERSKEKRVFTVFYYPNFTFSCSDIRNVSLLQPTEVSDYIISRVQGDNNI